MMKRGRTSYAFLMEMMWVCVFFLICASIFVLAFARAEQISRRADAMNQAVQAASNVMEEVFSMCDVNSPEEEAPDGSGEAFERFVGSYAETAAVQYSSDEFVLQVETSVEEGLLQISVQAVDALDDSVLYTLTGVHAISPEEGGQS